jgi:hypothetical protein
MSMGTKGETGKKSKTQGLINKTLPKEVNITSSAYYAGASKRRINACRLAIGCCCGISVPRAPIARTTGGPDGNGHNGDPFQSRKQVEKYPLKLRPIGN